MPIKTSDVRQTLLRDLNRHARKWAGHDGVVSKQEEESRIYSWERDTKLEVVREAITELRAEKGGEDVLVEEIVDRLLDRS